MPQKICYFNYGLSITQKYHWPSNTLITHFFTIFSPVFIKPSFLFLILLATSSSSLSFLFPSYPRSSKDHQWWSEARSGVFLFLCQVLYLSFSSFSLSLSLSQSLIFLFLFLAKNNLPRLIPLAKPSANDILVTLNSFSQSEEKIEREKERKREREKKNLCLYFLSFFSLFFFCPLLCCEVDDIHKRVCGCGDVLMSLERKRNNFEEKPYILI